MRPNIFHTRMRLAALAVSVIGAATCGTATAGPDHIAQVAAYFDANLADWSESPQIVSAIREQNAETASLSQEEVEALDLSWRAEMTSEDGVRPTVDQLMHREVSRFLKEKQFAADWMVVEIILMDQRGLNVGISTPTSDRWQGDEAKFQKTFDTGLPDLFIDEVEFEPETGLLLSQVSRAIFDPVTNDPIGAITVSINMNKL